MEDDDNESHKSLEEPLVDPDVQVSSPEPEGTSDAEAEEFLERLERDEDYADHRELKVESIKKSVNGRGGKPSIRQAELVKFRGPFE